MALITGIEDVSEVQGRDMFLLFDLVANVIVVFFIGGRIGIEIVDLVLTVQIQTKLQTKLRTKPQSKLQPKPNYFSQFPLRVKPSISPLGMK